MTDISLYYLNIIRFFVIHFVVQIYFLSYPYFGNKIEFLKKVKKREKREKESKRRTRTQSLEQKETKTKQAS